MKIPRNEYPRPQMVRDSFINLNGKWEFEYDHSATGIERRFYERERLNEEITVPYPPESILSGQNKKDFCKSVWYKRSFTIPDQWYNGRTFIHFGAVDHSASVWINGRYTFAHKGGYTPFCIDISDFLKPGENTVILNAYDDTRDPMQPSGKQSDNYNSYGCFYTRVTGIWQTVWLENVPDIYIKKLKLTPDVDNKCLYIEAELNKPVKESVMEASCTLDGKPAGSCNVVCSGNYIKTVLDIENPQLWGPLAPVLYDLEIKIGKDKVKSYFGMRKVSIEGRAININGKPVFQRLVLDQQYFPDGIYTAPDDKALLNDIQLAIEAGFNGARMHMKIFEPRYLYWADKTGFLLWSEYPNWGLDSSSDRALMHMLPEWLESIERDYNHPSIVGWCPFNETGTNRYAPLQEAVYKATKIADPFRPCIDTSGYTHSAFTDVYDVHDYEQDPAVFKRRYECLNDGTPNEDIHVNFKGHDIPYAGQPYFVSEFGGLFYDPNGGREGWGYGQAPSGEDEFMTRYEGLTAALLENPGVCGFCYTQLTDVEQEMNGIYTYERKTKFDLSRIRKANMKKAAIEE